MVKCFMCNRDISYWKSHNEDDVYYCTPCFKELMKLKKEKEEHLKDLEK